jgi:hypothetical protein
VEKLVPVAEPSPRDQQFTRCSPDGCLIGPTVFIHTGEDLSMPLREKRTI